MASVVVEVALMLFDSVLSADIIVLIWVCLVVMCAVVGCLCRVCKC